MSSHDDRLIRIVVQLTNNLFLEAGSVPSGDHVRLGPRSKCQERFGF